MKARAPSAHRPQNRGRRGPASAMGRGQGRPHAFGSNTQQREQLSEGQSSTLQDTFAMIVNGQMQDAKSSAAQIASHARQNNDNQTAQMAGKIWTLANSFIEIQQIISGESMEGVKDKSAQAGELIRALMSSGEISQEDGQRALKSAGGYWSLANKESKSSTNADSSGAAATAMNGETVEQYKLPTGRNGAHCGIATSLMLLMANGKGNMGEANQLVSEMYIYKEGTDVDLMAKSLRKRGLENAEATRSGTFTQLVATLQKGQPVPFGVTHAAGEVVRMNKSSSSNYAHYRPGDRHYRKFGGSGHWVLVVGFEGSPENPTHFLYNDPDVGGQLRATKSELERMGVSNGNFYQVNQ